MFNESNENVLNKWVENPYWHYFFGDVCFQHKLSFDRTELIKFRQRIEGVILGQSYQRVLKQLIIGHPLIIVSVKHVFFIFD